MKTVLLLVLTALSQNAFAGDKENIQCNPDGNQLQLNSCASEDFAKADKALNGVYQQILSEYKDNPLFLEKLKAAQRLWVRLRDAEVEARFPIGKSERGTDVWGSSYPMSVDAYRAGLTRQRTRQLHLWLDGLPEGDLSAGSVRRKQD
ncbi:lysozyme inhibitor LprI family protein [Luteimonas aquatica]|uniref:lysozyme inhibitor LprI family protein n=1 Tax=Luteimonas aquatica TaxID=450364 RepID=UPI001F58A350|nr:lysozyme inhibitor LprI family protein [Luteimonas aquatica]